MGLVTVLANGIMTGDPALIRRCRCMALVIGVVVGPRQRPRRRPLPGRPAHRDPGHDVRPPGHHLHVHRPHRRQRPARVPRAGLRQHRAAAHVRRPARDPDRRLLGRAAQTPLGRYIYAVGSDRRTPDGRASRSRRSSSRPTSSARSSRPSPGWSWRPASAPATRGAGAGFELDSIVAVVLGGTALSGGRGGRRWARSPASFLLALIANMLNLLGISPFTQRVVNGVIIIVAIAIYTSRRRESVTAALDGRRPGGSGAPVRLSNLGLWLGLLPGPVRGPHVARVPPARQACFNVIRQASVVGIAAVGVTLVMITGGVDLSVGAVILFGSVLAAHAHGRQRRQHPAGRRRGPAAWASSWAWSTASSWPAGGCPPSSSRWAWPRSSAASPSCTPVAPRPVRWRPRSGRSSTGASASCPCWPSCSGWSILAGLIVQNRTTLGRRIYLVGSNPRAARLSGVPVTADPHRRLRHLGPVCRDRRAGAAGPLGRVQQLRRAGLRVRRARGRGPWRHHVPGRSRRHRRHASRACSSWPRRSAS